MCDEVPYLWSISVATCYMASIISASTQSKHIHTHTWISPVNQHLCAHCDISITEASQEGTKPKLSYNKPQLHGKACKNWGHTLHCLFVIQITVNDIYPCITGLLFDPGIKFSMSGKRPTRLFGGK